MNVSIVLLSMLLFSHIVGFASQEQIKSGMRETISSKVPSIQINNRLPGKPSIVEDFEWENVSDEEEPLISPRTQSAQKVELLTQSECDTKGDHEAKVELDQKVLVSVPSTQKSVRDAQLFWRLYDMGTRCINEEYAFLQDSDKQEYLEIMLQGILSIVKENNNVLCVKRKLQNNKITKEFTPLVAFAQTFSNFYSQENYKMHWYRKAFFMLLQIDIDNDRRIEALQCFVQARQSKLVDGLMCEKIDISNTHDLVSSLVDAHREVIDKQNFFSRLVQKGDWSYAKLPQDESQSTREFIEQNHLEQAKALSIAHALIKKGASLTKLNDDFPSIVHTKKCVSCCYLRNCMLDKRESQKS